MAVAPGLELDVTVIAAGLGLDLDAGVAGEPVPEPQWVIAGTLHAQPPVLDAVAVAGREVVVAKGVAFELVVEGSLQDRQRGWLAARRRLRFRRHELGRTELGAGWVYRLGTVDRVVLIRSPFGRHAAGAE